MQTYGYDGSMMYVYTISEVYVSGLPLTVLGTA